MRRNAFKLNTINYLKNSLFFAILSILTLNPLKTYSQELCELKLNIENINHKPGGKIFISVYSDSEKYESRSYDMFKFIELKAESEKILHTVMLPEGKYALTLLHDINGNEKMDFNILQIPKEGYCFSNLPEDKLRPPDWDQASFNLTKEGLKVDLKLRYILD